MTHSSEQFNLDSLRGNRYKTVQWNGRFHVINIKNRCYNYPQYTSLTELTVADFLFYIDVKAVKSRIRSEVTEHLQ